MAIITISRQMGSLGDEIAKAVADKLNYDFIDKPEIAKALADYGLRVHENFDEKGLSFWESFSHQKKRLLYLIKVVLSDFAKKGNVVIYGWGAQILFKDLPGVLRDRIIAPFEVRTRRLVEQKGYKERDAEKILRKSDRDSAGFISSFFKYDWEDKDLYDLIINTNTISVDTGVGLIINTLDAHEFKVRSEETTEKLTDLSLQYKLEAVLEEFPKVVWVNVSVDRGIVDLSGSADSAQSIKECEDALSKVEGVVSVNNRLYVMEDAE